ncbi:tyrosine-type recombinase/integrase [Sporosarcina sp. SAFN-010]|uniref:tyrosine-type recombinase/integrase n=1 Tax=Sporosarcina sp. SAFN-010 TaxID=3387273 RepID=UPI003F7D50E6
MKTSPQASVQSSLLIHQAIPEFQDWLSRRGLSSETVRRYHMDIRQFSNWLAMNSNGPVLIDEITTKRLEGFVDYLSKERNCLPRSVNRKINVVSVFFQCMVKKKYLLENPAEDVERMKVPDIERTFLSKDEVERIIGAIDHPVIHYFTMTMAYTGIRVNECINLTKDDVDFDANCVRVINGKGGKNRVVPMNLKLKEQLQIYLAEHRPQTDSLFFFALKKTGTVSAQYINRTLKLACEKTGIEKHVTSHFLRHSFASYLVQKDTHVAVIQRLLGHASLKTTSVYLHVRQEDMQDAVNRIDF